MFGEKSFNFSSVNFKNWTVKKAMSLVFQSFTAIAATSVGIGVYTMIEGVGIVARCSEAMKVACY